MVSHYFFKNRKNDIFGSTTPRGVQKMIFLEWFLSPRVKLFISSTSNGFFKKYNKINEVEKYYIWKIYLHFYSKKEAKTKAFFENFG